MATSTGPEQDTQQTDAKLVLAAETGMDSFTSEEWSSLSGTDRSCKASADLYNPFISHAFLSSLEDSGCVGGRTGWFPQHLSLRDENGKLLGAAPAYAKSHSQGEYVFDYGWADAFQRAGGSYYPKLQCSVPFTPATGPRLLVAGTGEVAEQHRSTLATALRAVCDRLGTSSVHVTFANSADTGTLKADGYLERLDQQFHFRNEGYDTYDDFLATLASRKRKSLKKERRTAVENGIEIEWLTGPDLTEDVWDDFYRFYVDTGSRKWGRPYLNREFYSLIGERMADDILLVVAKRDGRRIAGAINFIGGDTLFGRNWGCVEDHRFLHFEVCYHQAIDFALSRGLRTVEAGAQGEHKLQRGYLPVTTHSLHYIAHPGLRSAVADYLQAEREDIQSYSAILREHGPYRKTNGAAEGLAGSEEEDDS